MQIPPDPDDETIAEVFTARYERDGLPSLSQLHVELTDTVTDDLGRASADFSAATADLRDGLRAYEEIVRAHDLDVTEQAVRDAARVVENGITRLAVAHTWLTGSTFPTGEGEPVSDGEWAESADDVDEEWDPTWPAPNELPVVVPANRILAEGDWGALRLREFLVHSTGVKVVIDWILRRNGADADAWQAAWSIFDWWGEPRIPVTAPEGFTVMDRGADASGGSQTIAGQKVLWVRPLPSAADVEIVLELPRLGLEGLIVTIPAAVSEVSTVVVTVVVDPAHDSASGRPRPPHS